MKIVDTHVHLWNLEELRLPWLEHEGDILNRSYGLNDYKQACGRYNIEKAVYIEVDADIRDKIKENESAMVLCKAADNIINGIVISADLTDNNCRQYLEKYLIPGVKGVRHVLHVPSSAPGACLSDIFIKNVRYIGKIGMLFEGCVRNEELEDLYILAKMCPDTTIILDHMGIVDPDKISNKNASAANLAYTEKWIKNLELLASQSNVFCKISGLNPNGSWSAELLKPAVKAAIEAFGEDRIMYASNFPVCNISTGIEKWIKALIEITNDEGPIFQEKLFSGNAERIYSLNS